MSLHKCPSCKEYGFTWMVDEEISPLTIWGCSECSYQSFEDESQESKCPDCNYAHRMQLKDQKSEYWWCIKCEKKTIIK